MDFSLLTVFKVANTLTGISAVAMFSLTKNHLGTKAHQGLHVLVVTAMGLIVVACGAPTKSASDVSSIFATNSEPLPTKLDGMCKTLETRDKIPNVRGMDIDLDGCDEAGLIALDLTKIKAFAFKGLDGEVPERDKSEILRRRIRTQVWLNKTIIGLAAALGGKLKERSDSGDNTGFIKVKESDATGGLSELAKTTTEVLEEPTFDLKEKSFSTVVRFKVDGVVKVDNTIRVDGGLIGNEVAITVRSEGEDKTYEESLIQKLEAVIFIVPHASDIYLDAILDISINNPGTPALFDAAINNFLGSALKGVIDGFLTL